ncbi:unnamed protein product [Schistosoma turkestanicum]|nr:unnamed protein product [Schistosoma turkestanicum]
MEFMNLFNLNMSTMITWAFGAMSKENNNSVCNTTNSCTFDATAWDKPHRLSSIVLIIMVIVLGIIIIFIKALYTAYTRSAIIMIIILNMMTIDFGLLTAFGDWNQLIIAAIVLVSTLLLAVLSSPRMIEIREKWRMLIIAVCLVVVAAGIIFSISIRIWPEHKTNHYG